MKHYVEVRNNTRRNGPPKLVPLSEVHNYRGFRSVFAWNEVLTEHVNATGSTRDMRGMPVYCDVVLVDFDNTDPHEFISYLDTARIGYEVYDSGNRSVHVHIPIEPIEGEWVPRAVKHFVRQHAPNADLSFYHQAGMYRLPGTYHKKTGRSKELVNSVCGDKLIITEPAVQPLPVRDADASTVPEDFYMCLLRRRGPGQRSPHIWLLARMACDIGLSREDAMLALIWWNDRFADPPQDMQTLERQLDEGFKPSARRYNENSARKMA